MKFDVIIKSEANLTSGVYLTKEHVFEVLVIPEYFMKFEFDKKYSNSTEVEIVSVYSGVAKRSTGFGDFIMFYWLINMSTCKVIVFAKSENKSVNEYLYEVGFLKIEMIKNFDKKRE